MFRGLMSDAEWAFFAPFLIENRSRGGRRPQDHRKVLDGIFWITRTGSPDAGMCGVIASMTESRDQWNAYCSIIVERLQGFQPGSAVRVPTDRNSFDPADMKTPRTALFIIGSARSVTSRNFVGSMTAAMVEWFADAHGPLRALLIGKEWGQLYVSNFYEILTI